MGTKNRRADCEGGFSITELLVVLCGFAILAGIGVPVLDTIMSRYETTMAAQRIAAQLQNARMKAVASNEPFRVRFSLGHDSYQIETGNGTLHSGPFFLPRGTTINNGDGNPTTFPGNYVQFQPNGSLPLVGVGSAGRVKLINRDGLRIDIIISAAGMVRLTPPYNTGTPPY